MKRTISMLAIAGLCSVGAAFAAQTPAATPAPAAKPAKTAKAAKAPKAEAATYTGCVAKGTTAGTFVLNDATAAGSTDKTSYDVKGASLAKHVGHKVEVSGTVAKPASGNAVLTAKHVKMVAATCS